MADPVSVGTRGTFLRSVSAHLYPGRRKHKTALARYICVHNSEASRRKAILRSATQVKPYAGFIHCRVRPFMRLRISGRSQKHSLIVLLCCHFYPVLVSEEVNPKRS